MEYNCLSTAEFPSPSIEVAMAINVMTECPDKKEGNRCVYRRVISSRNISIILAGETMVTGVISDFGRSQLSFALRSRRGGIAGLKPGQSKRLLEDCTVGESVW